MADAERVNDINLIVEAFKGMVDKRLRDFEERVGRSLRDRLGGTVYTREQKNELVLWGVQQGLALARRERNQVDLPTGETFSVALYNLEGRVVTQELSVHSGTDHPILIESPDQNTRHLPAKSPDYLAEDFI